MAAIQRPSILLDDIAKAIKAEVFGDATTVKVSGVSSLEDAGQGDLAYVASERFVGAALQSNAVAFVVDRPIPTLQRVQLIVPNPIYASALIIDCFFTPAYQARGIAKWVVQGENVQIGPDVSIYPFVTLGDRVRIGARVRLYPGVFIGDDSQVGDDSILYPNVTMRERCSVGKRVIIHAGTVIGSDGFGYVEHEGHHHKIPQRGTVVIEDDVELGANVTVDRATFERTVIKRGTKVDNLVQIGHNVSIGEDCILVAQVGISGSTILGNRVIVGGQAGVSDHLEVGDRVMIAAKSGVIAKLRPGQVVSGSPALPHEVSLKAHATFARLPEMRQHLRNLERRVQTLESGGRRRAAGNRRKKP